MKKLLFVLSIVLLSGCSPHAVNEEATKEVETAKSITVENKTDLFEFDFSLLNNIKLIHVDEDNKLLIYSTLDNYDEYLKQLDLDGNISFANNGKASIREFIVLLVNYEQLEIGVEMDFTNFKENVLKQYESNSSKLTSIKDEDNKFLSVYKYSGLTDGYAYVSGFKDNNKFVYTTLISNMDQDVLEPIASEIYDTIVIK